MSTLSQRSSARALAGRRDASPRLVLAIVCAGVVLASLDLFIVNVALPAIARDLHEHSLSSLSWVLNAYAIAYASLLVLFGRLAEARPRQHGFLLGVAVFTAASAACGAATSLPMLVAFRVVQAAGAALLTPTSLSLVLATAPPERRQSSVRAWTAVGGLAAALGPVAGGLLVAATWRWVFLVNVQIGIAALVLGWQRLPHVARIGAGRTIALGATTFAAGIVWWALAAGLSTDYAGEFLGGMLLTGAGVGLTLPTFMASAAASLPPSSFATGSAVVNMLRQVGLAIGVAVLVAVLGTPRTPAAGLSAFQHAWLVIAAASFSAALTGAALGRGGRPSSAAAAR